MVVKKRGQKPLLLSIPLMRAGRLARLSAFALAARLRPTLLLLLLPLLLLLLA